MTTDMYMLCFTSLLAAILLGTSADQAICNGVPSASGIVVPGGCNGNAQGSYTFSCETRLASYYASGDCSGSPLHSGAIPGGENIVCDQTDCASAILVVYESNGDCAATGNYTRNTVAVGTCSSGITLSCADGDDSYTIEYYESSDCSGSPRGTSSRSTGCELSGTTDQYYTAVTCVGALADTTTSTPTTSLQCGSSIEGSLVDADASNTYAFELPNTVLNNDNYTQSVTFFACASSELVLEVQLDGNSYKRSDEVDIFEYYCGHDAYAFTPAIENIYRPLRSSSSLDIVVSAPADYNDTFGAYSAEYVLHYVCPGDDPTAHISNIQNIELSPQYYTAVTGLITDNTHYQLDITADLLAASPLLIDVCDTPYPLTIYAVSYTNVERQEWGALDLALQPVAACDNGWNQQYHVDLNDTETYGDEFLFQFVVNYDSANLTTDVVNASAANVLPFIARFRMDGRVERVDITQCATVVSGRVDQDTEYRLDLDQVSNGDYLFNPTLINPCSTPFAIDVNVVSVATDASVALTKIGNCSHGKYAGVNALYEFYPNTSAYGAQYSIRISSASATAVDSTPYVVMFDCGELPPRNISNPVRGNISQCDEKFSGVAPGADAEVEAVYVLDVDAWLASGQPQSVLQPVIIDVCETQYPLTVDVMSKDNFLAEMNDTEFMVPVTTWQSCGEHGFNNLLTFYPNATRYGSTYIIALRLQNSTEARQQYEDSNAEPYVFSVRCDHSAFSSTTMTTDSTTVMTTTATSETATTEAATTASQSSSKRTRGLNAVPGSVWLTLVLLLVLTNVGLCVYMYRREQQRGGDDGAYVQLNQEKDDQVL